MGVNRMAGIAECFRFVPFYVKHHFTHTVSRFTVVFMLVLNMFVDNSLFYDMLHT